MPILLVDPPRREVEHREHEHADYFLQEDGRWLPSHCNIDP